MSWIHENDFKGTTTPRIYLNNGVVTFVSKPMRIRSNTRLERSPSKPACLPPRAKSWQGEPPHTMSARKPSAAVISRTSGRIFEVSSLLVSIRCWRSLRHAGSLSTARTNLTACWSEYSIPPMPEKSPMPFNRRGTKFCLGRRRLSKVPAADYRVQMLAAVAQKSASAPAASAIPKASIPKSRHSYSCIVAGQSSWAISKLGNQAV